MNNIQDEKYAGKISYETFKILGKIYERRFQKDIQGSLDGINPILDFVDTIFVTLSRMLGKMNYRVKNSFSLAYAEHTHLHMLNNLENNQLEVSLNDLNDFNFTDTSTTEYLLTSSKKFLDDGLFKEINENPETKFVYSLAAAKRRLERKIDWTLCSFDKEMISSIYNHKDTQLMQLPSLIRSTYNPDSYYPENADLAAKLNTKIHTFLNSDRWQSTQHLSLLFHDDDTEKGLSYIESRMVPDANDLEEVISLIHDLEIDITTVDRTSSLMGVTPRMAKYYLDAAEMIGLLERQDSNYKITEFGRKIKRYSDEDQIRIIEQSMVNLPVFKSFLIHLKATNKTRFRMKDIANFLDNNTNLSPKTSHRRASTLASWLCTVGILKRRNSRLFIRDDVGQKRISEFFLKNSDIVTS